MKGKEKRGERKAEEGRREDGKGREERRENYYNSWTVCREKKNNTVTNLKFVRI